ncbi:MAG TPA: aldo/keto reductase [Bryobacteraceae bacterium]|jgi:predicted aldo/keto reductase-like oxidoreductase|nr:aldo/keto reductase [Bryobacteraceae bacterium]
MPEDLNRRLFLGGMLAAGALTAAPPEEERRGDMLYRTLGRTGQKVSCIGLGGSNIGKTKDQSLATQIVRTGIDHGITFMDNSWDYNNGNGQGEIKMGNALRDGYRQKVFLMTKVDGRTKQSAAQQIDESLKRLQTDHVDLMLFHEVIRMEDPDRIFADDGAVHAFLEAKKAGKLHYIGFSGHKDPAIHLRVLDVAHQHNFQFDAIMFPNNVMDASFRSFGANVLPAALKQNLGILCMKPFGGGIIVQKGGVNPVEALHFVLNQPVSVCINGCENMRDLNQALEAVKTFKPMSHQQVSEIVSKARPEAETGKFELFKTSNKFDSTAQHPEWLG